MYRRLALIAAFSAASSLSAFAGLIINPVFDAGITSDPNAATIMAAIQSAIDVYQNAFSDNITVKLEFDEMTSGLGSSQTFYGSLSYASYRFLLNADATSADDATALANIPASSTDRVFLTSANFRALGVNAVPPGGAADSIIRLNTSLMNLDRTNIDPAKYDLFAVVSHEIDEALGIGSELNGLTNGASVPADEIWAFDLYRYDQNGNRSLNTNSSSLAYFSLDGTTTLAQFNQDQRGDYSDFFSLGAHTPQIQDAFATPGATPNFGVELRALDVLGYDVAAPEPATAVLFSLALGALAIPAIRRRIG